MSEDSNKAPEAAERLSIRELKRRAGPVPVEAALWVQLDQAAEKETRQGKTYVELVFADGIDSLTLRVWSDHAMFEAARQLRAPHFLELTGKWVDRGQYGIETSEWTVRALDESEREKLLRGPLELQEKQAADVAYIVHTVSQLSDPRLRGLCERFLEEFQERFLRTAAAREYHHARRGGLVEHVAQMMRSAEALLGVYTHINADLVLTGVLFHDCGKLWENSYQKLGFTMPHQEIGELISHIPLGMELINRLWRELMESEEAAAWAEVTPRNEDVRLHLLHLIAAHHGTREFGSPVLPKTPEAMLLHFVDNIDAKIEMFAEAYEKAPLVSKNVYERSRPLFHSVVRPLPVFAPAETTQGEDSEACEESSTAEDSSGSEPTEAETAEGSSIAEEANQGPNVEVDEAPASETLETASPAG